MPTLSNRLSIHRIVASGGGGLDFSGLPNLPVSRQASAGWKDQATIDAFASASLWVDAFSTYSNVSGTTPAITGDPIAAALNNSTGNLFTQSNAANRPTLAAGPAIAGDYTKLLTGNPGTTGTQKLIIATTDGIAEAEVDITSTYDLRNIEGLVHWAAGNFTTAEIEKIKAFAIAEGAVENWSTFTWNNYFRDMALVSWDTPIPNSVTGLSSAWRDNQITNWNTSIPNSISSIAAAWWGNELTSWNTPIPNSVENVSFTWRDNQITSWNTPIPSSVITISFAWRNNQLTSWSTPIPSSVTDVSFAWSGNPLQNFAANLFNGCPCTNFNNAFTNTNLTQTSIDNILVSIESNGTSNGTFDQSGGSAPSATGEAAIDALRARGWTVNVTGGY